MRASLRSAPESARASSAVLGLPGAQDRSQEAPSAPESLPASFATQRRQDRGTRGTQLAKVARVLGFSLYPWQRYVADVALELLPGGNYAYRTVGAQIARQNGKSTLIASRIVLEVLRPNRHVAYTAQDRMAAREKLEELYVFLKDSPIAEGVDKFVGHNGRERILFRNGSTARVMTPNRKAGRGLSLDLVVIDEALTIDPEVLSSLLPTMATRSNAQLWLVSNAGIPGVSNMLARYRQLGHESLSQVDSTMCWHEWGPELDEQGELVGTPYDEQQWYRANPSLGQPGGVTLEALRDAARGLELTQFKREHLNLWAELGSEAVIALEQWERLTAPHIVIGASPVLAVDVSPERDRASIAVASREAEYVPVEIVENEAGVGWTLERLRDLSQRWGAGVVIDGGSAAGSLVAPLEAAGVVVHVLGARDYARACGSFYDLVTGGRLAHRADWRLSDAVKGASKRPLGDQWAWSRRMSSVDITPLVAASLAAYWADSHELAAPAIF